MSDQNKNIKTEKSNGRFYTPSYIVKNILDMSGYHDTHIVCKHVIDNCCGDGAFITEIVDRYCIQRKKDKISATIIATELETYIHGIELDEIECKKCIANVNKVAESHKVFGVKWDIICADALVTTQYNEKMDYVLGNPPYVRVHNLGESVEKIKGFSFAQNGMTDLYIVFYEIGLKMLNSTGVLGYITPSSFFSSLAGKHMRKKFVEKNIIEKVVDLKHFQAFCSTTYTAITVLRMNKETSNIDYYQFDEKNLIPYYVETLSPKDYYIAENFYFSNKGNLDLLKKIFFNLGQSDITVKNGYATLSDDVFINSFQFESRYIIPVIKASRGIKKTIIYPYDKKGKLITESSLQQDEALYAYLLAHKERLLKRDNKDSNNSRWYAFGRSQAITDTYRDKIAINSLLRSTNDLKIIDAPTGTGVYSGLYLTSKTIDTAEIKKALATEEFITYISLLGKYKSGGYYTFSTKDVKLYLNYKFSYNGGLIEQ